MHNDYNRKESLQNSLDPMSSSQRVQSACSQAAKTAYLASKGSCQGLLQLGGLGLGACRAALPVLDLVHTVRLHLMFEPKLQDSFRQASTVGRGMLEP